MNQRKQLNKKKQQRIRRVKAVIRGTAERPRLVVKRTNQYLYAQLIDDVKQHTIASVSSTKAGKDAKAKKVDQAFAMGEAMAKKAVEKGVAQVVFDRRSYQFHGRVKSFAEGAQKGGLKI
jgi:large subunit ribosomal protein L18